MTAATSRPGPPCAARWVVLGCALAVTALRALQLIVWPRLWAEEATIYLAYTVHHSFVQSLLLVPTSGVPAGTFNLPAATAAHLLPLERAPWPTLVMALVCQLVPLLIHHVLRPFFGGLVTDDPGLVMSQAWSATVRGPRFLVLTAAILLLALVGAWVASHLRAEARRTASPFVLLTASSGSTARSAWPTRPTARMSSWRAPSTTPCRPTPRSSSRTASRAATPPPGPRRFRDAVEREPVRRRAQRHLTCSDETRSLPTGVSRRESTS